MDNTRKKELKKHVAVIHCSNSLSLLQRKISNALLYHAYPQLLQIEEHEISVKQLCYLIGYNGNNHDAIKKSLKGLVQTVMEWNIIHDGIEEDWTASTILACVRIKGPQCFYAYSPRMRALLCSPKIYGKIKLNIQAKFKSSYGLALYENCARYNGLPATKWFDYTVFRMLMGVPEDKYIIFRDFKKRVLDKSVEEVNHHSDIDVTPEIRRKGREVISIRFILKMAQKQQLSTTDSCLVDETDCSIMPQNNKMLNRLVFDLNISSELALQLIKEYGVEYIAEKVDIIIKSKNYQNGNIPNLTGYLIDALRKNYLKPTPVNVNEKKYQQQNELKTQQELNILYERYQAKELIHLFMKIGASQQALILKEFEFDIRRTSVSPMFASDGLNNPIIGDYFLKFIKHKHTVLLDKIISFDAFCTMHQNGLCVKNKEIRNEDRARS